MPENPEATDKVVDGEAFVTHIDAVEETIRLRGIEETVYLASSLFASKMIGNGPARVLVERDDDGDLVMLSYEALRTPKEPATNEESDPFRKTWNDLSDKLGAVKEMMDDPFKAPEQAVELIPALLSSLWTFQIEWVVLNRV